MDTADDEIEALSSIWDGVSVQKSENERKIIHKIKSLEDEDVSASVLVECTIYEGYPAVSPKVKLTNPRGIGEAEFRELCRQIEEVVTENSDEMPIICEIFQKCSDYLSENQHINMDCSICLRNLTDFPIIVTKCDHFMHSDCFCRYLKQCSRNIRKEIDDALPHFRDNIDTSLFCPVCREILIASDRNNFESRISKMVLESEKHKKTLRRKKRRVSHTADDVRAMMNLWREEQNRLSQLYARQKQNGGIIDIEEDKKRRQFFIGSATSSELEES